MYGRESTVRSILISLMAFLLSNYWKTPGLFIIPKLIVISLGIILAFVLLQEFTKNELLDLYNRISKQFVNRAGAETDPN